MQELGKETRGNFLPLLRKVYEEKYKIPIKNDGESVYFYDMHDGKMLYILTQNSLFNRTHSPFLLCKCQRGDTVCDSDRSCQLITHKDYLDLILRSMRRWQNKSAKLKVEGKVYHVRDRRKWVAEKNSGICHLGIDPKCLRLDQICFDEFHLSCSITRRLMLCLRAFINKKHCDVMDRFYSDALTF